MFGPVIRMWHHGLGWSLLDLWFLWFVWCCHSSGCTIFKQIVSFCCLTRYRAFKFQPRIYPLDGLNSLRYKLVAHEARPLYTWIHIAVPPQPLYFRGSYRAATAGKTRCHINICLLAAVSVLSLAFTCVLLLHFVVHWSCYTFTFSLI